MCISWREGTRAPTTASEAAARRLGASGARSGVGPTGSTQPALRLGRELSHDGRVLGAKNAITDDSSQRLVSLALHVPQALI